MVCFNLKNWLKKSKWVLALYLLNVGNALASSTTATNLPFDETLQKLKDAISGPFLTATAVIMIIATCIMLAFGEWGDGFKKMINIVLWLSVAFAASGFVSTMFGSGAVF